LPWAGITFGAVPNGGLPSHVEGEMSEENIPREGEPTPIESSASPPVSAVVQHVPNEGGVRTDILNAPVSEEKGEDGGSGSAPSASDEQRQGERGDSEPTGTSDHRYDDCKLDGQDFSRRNLAGASFRRASLRGANFEDADLSQAVFDHADLTGAIFTDADLTRASFRHAVLINAGIEDVHLPGADLSGAQTGTAQVKLETRLEGAKAMAETLRSVFIASTGLLAYVGATVFSASDAVVLTNKTTMSLPLVDAQVSVHGFFYMSATLALALSSYTLSRVDQFACVVARLPSRLPEGPPLQEQVDAWVLSCVGVLHGGRLELRGTSELPQSVSAIFSWLGAKLPGAIVRWLAPFVLWMMIYRFFVACRPNWSALSSNIGFAYLVLSFLVSWAITFGLRNYSQLIDGEKPRVRRRYSVAFALGLIAIAIGVRSVQRATVRYGAVGESLANSQLTGADLSGWNLARSNLDGADVAHTNLTLTHFQEAHLGKVDLRFAKLTRASFNSADLTGAKLRFTTGERPNFGFATLNGVDLRQATLPGVILQDATLQEAKLRYFTGVGALAAGANFAKAELDDAVFDHAFLNGSEFTGGVHLFRASFNGADLSSANFSGAQLYSAHLRNANLTATSFADAHISMVDMTGAFLLRTKMNVVEAWRLGLDDARLTDVTVSTQPPGSMAQAKFDRARLTRVRFSNAPLSGSTFKDAVLMNVDFTTSNLTGARFEGARFVNVKLAMATLTGVTLTLEQKRNTDISESWVEQ
jgi:uncharacterized protein YjbI with pentapeptide repeats